MDSLDIKLIKSLQCLPKIKCNFAPFSKATLITAMHKQLIVRCCSSLFSEQSKRRASHVCSRRERCCVHEEVVATVHLQVGCSPWRQILLSYRLYKRWALRCGPRKWNQSKCLKAAFFLMATRGQPLWSQRDIFWVGVGKNVKTKYSYQAFTNQCGTHSWYIQPLFRLPGVGWLKLQNSSKESVNVAISSRLGDQGERVNSWTLGEKKNQTVIGMKLALPAVHAGVFMYQYVNGKLHVWVIIQDCSMSPPWRAYLRMLALNL